jgi:NTP pyrophosphatase (non-canonical NTP hydrolase)
MEEQMSNVDLNKYKDFVEEVTSNESNMIGMFTNRINELNDTTDVNIPLLLTAAIGLAAEGGEFCEIPKKVLFQGKPLDNDTIFHMKRELGDVLWYWINACRALNLDPNEVVAENVRKLEARYPGGSFDVLFSENRKEGDL